MSQLLRFNDRVKRADTDVLEVSYFFDSQKFWKSNDRRNYRSISFRHETPTELIRFRSVYLELIGDF